MAKRKDIKSVMIIGSGPIVIGQAAEFDYAGPQACKALKAAGLEVVLVNPNPATIMTDHTSADQIYIEPLTLETLRRIIIKEKPDSLLSTLHSSFYLKSRFTVILKQLIQINIRHKGCGVGHGQME